MTNDPNWLDALQEAEAIYRRQQTESQNNARGVLIALPESGGLPKQESRDLQEEDDPANFNSQLAKTREGDPSISVVPLFETPNGISLNLDGTEIIDLDQTINFHHRELIVRIVKRSVSISNRAWVAHFVWSESTGRLARLRRTPILAGCDFEPTR